MSTVKLAAHSGEDESIATAIWDTGAAHSAIARSVAEAIKLKPVASVRLATFTGSAELQSGLVAVSICMGGYRLETMMAVMDDAAMGDHEVTLGLDFICMGDFALSHDEDGYPMFSFRYPPMSCIDFQAMAKNIGVDLATTEFSK